MYSVLQTMEATRETANMSQRNVLGVRITVGSLLPTSLTRKSMNLEIRTNVAEINHGVRLSLVNDIEVDITRLKIPTPIPVANDTFGETHDGPSERPITDTWVPVSPSPSDKPRSSVVWKTTLTRGMNLTEGGDAVPGDDLEESQLAPGFSNDNQVPDLTWFEGFVDERTLRVLANEMKERNGFDGIQE
jgi:hypothetical protein